MAVRRKATRKGDKPVAARLAVALREHKEALEQQAASAEILRAMSKSPGDAQPVFQAIVDKAHRLCGAAYSVLYRYDGKLISVVAARDVNANVTRVLRSRYPRPAERDKIVGRTLLEAKAFHTADLYGDRRFRPSRPIIPRRAVVGVPLVRDGTVLGAISCGRVEARAFSKKEIWLLQTFADQAVIAIENARLFSETQEALERQTATAEILKVIASSPADAQPVFDAIVRSALRLVGGYSALVLRLSDGMLHLAAHSSTSVSGDKAVKRFYPQPIKGVILHGRAIRSPRPHWVADTEKVPASMAAVKSMARKRGYRSLLVVPMLRDGAPIGSIGVSRKEPGEFSKHQITTLETFADQAVIAIENARLFNETREALEKQTATAEILRVLSESPADTQPVFDAIVRHAARLCESTYANVFRYDGEQLHLAASEGVSAEISLALEKSFPAPPNPSRVVGRVVQTGRVTRVEDTLADPQYDKAFAATLWRRRILGVPLLRADKTIGAITVGWDEPGPILQRHEDLLKTFADQAVIAIESVRLFNETKEALERQTATGEILKVISSSPTDVQPVFDAVVQSCRRLFGGMDVALNMVQGEQFDRVAFSESSGVPDDTAGSFPMPLSEESIAGRAMLRAELVHIEDVAAATWLAERSRSIARRRGFRSALCAPMIREGRAIGSIIVFRAQPGRFKDEQVALLRTFADQAVIAIENARLFRELQERTAALTRSVGQLTALGEVGQAISSTLELDEVLRTIVQRAVQLAGLDGGSIYEFEERDERFHLRAAENIEEEILDVYRTSPIRLGEGAVGRAGATREPVVVENVLDESYQSRVRELLIRSGSRALLAVPLLREDHLLGALVVNRKLPGPFAPEVIELLKTFATQSAVAIQNARLFREIAEKSSQLEVASRHKSQFLASMSHELRTPLNALLGFNEMILGDIYGEVPADMKPPLAQMQASGKHLLRLINNVLDLAKIEAGRMELALAEYSVHDTVESVRSTLQPLAVEKGLDFRAAVPADIPLAYGDPGRITQCLMNLAGNSLKFTKAGKVEISVAVDDGQLRYRVADTGIGIAPDKIEGLFTEFRQTDATVASEYGGTGLGLSISKKFVEMHGGRIWVESEPGRGSAFTFEIPLRAREGKAA